MNRVHKLLEEYSNARLPNVGFDIVRERTALVVTDPQNDFLHPSGVAYAVCSESIKENDTIENLKTLFDAATRFRLPIFISPHYYYPTDHGWKFEGALERLMHSIGMFNRAGPLDLEGFTGSGADWLEELRPYIEADETIVCSPHKVYGPENNDLVLQLRKQGIDKVIIAGMSANLCVESHLRELLETGFEVAVIADATAAAKVSGLDGFLAAFINFRMLASAVWTSDRAVSEMQSKLGTASAAGCAL